MEEANTKGPSKRARTLAGEVADYIRTLPWHYPGAGGKEAGDTFSMSAFVTGANRPSDIAAWTVFMADEDEYERIVKSGKHVDFVTQAQKLLELDDASARDLLEPESVDVDHDCWPGTWGHIGGARAASAMQHWADHGKVEWPEADDEPCQGPMPSPEAGAIAMKVAEEIEGLPWCGDGGGDAGWAMDRSVSESGGPSDLAAWTVAVGDGGFDMIGFDSIWDMEARARKLLELDGRTGQVLFHPVSEHTCESDEPGTEAHISGMLGAAVLREWARTGLIDWKEAREGIREEQEAEEQVS